MIHELKIKPEYFAAVVSGDKTFEIRNNSDRNFQVGDALLLKAWDGEFTGQTVERTVSYITDFEQKQGYVVLGLQKQHGTPAADWREAGESDPFGDRYNCDRDALPMGNVTDDALANQLFVCDHRHDMQSITLLTAGKERIRWLSRQLELRKQHEHELLANHRKLLIDKSELCDDLLDLIERMVSYLGLAGDEPEKDSYNPMKAWMYDAITTMAGQRQKPPVAVTETIRTAPERIWLQVGDQSHYHSEPFPSNTSEVTWCADSVVACEVPYVRADLVGHVVSPPLNLLIQMTDILKMCRSALITAYEDIRDGTAKGVIQYRIKLATKGINMAEHAIDAAAQANCGRFITDGQELELVTVLQYIVNGFSDDPAHDAAELLKRITGEVPWTGDSFQLPPRQGGEQIVKCPHCNAEHQDGSDAAEFIGWHGLCVTCELKGGEPCAIASPSSSQA